MDWRTWALRPRQHPGAVSRTSWRAVLKAFFSITMLTVVFTIIAGLVALIYGVGLVTPYILNQGYSYVMFVVLPFFVTVATVNGYPLLIYYLFVVATIVASCTWVLLSGYKQFFNEITMKAKSREHSPIFDISGLTFVNVFLSVLIVFIAILLGANDTGTPISGNIEEDLFLLANASVWEEIVVRVMLIGLPLLVIDLARRKLKKRWYSYVLGGKFEFGIPEVVLVLVSASIFGYAHYLGGWGAWKIPAASIGGIAFGYLFLKYGLPAAIVMHFATDYMTMPSQVFGFSNALDIMLVLLWFGLGIAFFIYYVLRIGEFLTGLKFLEERPQPVGAPWPQPWAYQPAQAPTQWQQPYPPVQYVQPPPVQPGPPVVPQQAFYGGYVCPNCRYTEARWVNGRFQCLRCGKLS